MIILLALSIYFVLILKLKYYQVIWFIFPCSTVIPLFLNIKNLMKLAKNPEIKVKNIFAIFMMCIVFSEAIVWTFFDRKILTIMFLISGTLKISNLKIDFSNFCMSPYKENLGERGKVQNNLQFFRFVQKHKSASAQKNLKIFQAKNFSKKIFSAFKFSARYLNF